MRLKTTALLLSMVFLVMVGPAWGEVVGRLTRVEGAVDIMPGGKLPAVAAALGSRVQTGDFVRTKSNARAEITFNDGSVVKVAQRSRVDVSEYSGAARRLALPRGKVQATVVPMAKTGAKETFQIRTPNAIAGVRGTSFYVYHQANITGVAVVEGVVRTASITEPSKGVILVAGTATTVAMNKPPTPPRPVTQMEMNNNRKDVTPTAGSSAAPIGGGAGGEGGSGTTATSGNAGTGTTGTMTESTAGSGTTTASGTGTSSGTASSADTATSTTSTTSAGTLSTDTLATASATLSGPLQTSTTTTASTVNTATAPSTTSPTAITVPVTDASSGSGTILVPTTPQFTSALGANLLSRDSTIDPTSSLLTIVKDGGIAPTLSGTTSLWSGSAAATLKGGYPTLPLQQPNHYWLGHLYSGGAANDTTTDGGAYAGFFGGMSLDGSRTADTRIAALYIDPTGKAGILLGDLPGAVSLDTATNTNTLSGSGTLTLTGMNPSSGLSPASFSAGWWDPKTGSAVVEITGPVIADLSSTTSQKGNGSPSEGFLLNAGLDFVSDMTNRGDVLHLGYLAADPSFGVWSRESFGSYSGTASQFVLTTNAEWGVRNADGSFTLNDAVKVISLGGWQEGALSATADGVWGNLASGSIRLLTGTLTGSANPATSTFGAVTIGSFIDLGRFEADPSLAASLGFPTLAGTTFAMAGGNASGGVDLGTLTFYSRKSGDPVSLWVAPNVSGSYSGTLGGQRFSLINSGGTGTVMGELFINSTGSSNTWIGTMNAMGETGSSTSPFRSDFDGIAAGHFTGTTFTGAAAGLSHPVTYLSSINGGSAQLTRFSGSSVASYGSLDGIMGGMSLWASTMSVPSDFKAVGLFTPSQPLTAGDYVFSAPITSNDLPTGSPLTADGGAYNGHLVAGVNLYGGGTNSPGMVGVMNALYVDPSGNAGILTGKFGGFLDGMTNVWNADGEVFPVALAAGMSPGSLNSAGGVTTIATTYSTASTFTGAPTLGAWTPGTYTRSYITATPQWGIAQFGLYAPYTAPPADGSFWHLDFTILDGYTPTTVLTGNMAGAPWDSTSGMLYAGTRAGWLDMQSSLAAATPTTGIFIGETVGTFNPTSLQAMTSGVWMETGKFLSLASTAAGQATLQKLNIPAVEVGKADFSGGNGSFDVLVKDVRFFAPASGGRPQIFATDNISGNYYVGTPIGSAALSQVAGAGYAVSGITPTFNIKAWDVTNGKWAGSFDYNGPSGVVAGMNNVQFSGVAAGRTSGGATAGTFTGTAAGMAR